MNSVQSTISVGCCGYPVARIKYYKYFFCVEINSTFYQLPELKTAEKWINEAPAGFEFIIKVWQLITHPFNSLTYRRLREKIPKKSRKYYGFFRPTKEVFNAWERTKEFANILKCKKYLFQCPASFKPTEINKNNFRIFFNSIKRSTPRNIQFIWEPRGDWSEEDIRQLCKELNLIHCVDPTRSVNLYGKFNYFRLHGTYVGKRIEYNYQFTDSQLKQIYKKCDKPVNYVMFNNSTMFDDALKFEKPYTLLHHAP